MLGNEEKMKLNKIKLSRFYLDVPRPSSHITHYTVLLVFFISHFTFHIQQCSAWQSKVGTTGANFLKINAAARQSAMANAFVAVADDVNTVQYNPAGLAELNNNELTATHIEYLAGLKYEYVGYLLPLTKSRIGFSGASLHAKMDETDAQCLPLGQIVLSDTVYTLSIARKFKTRFSWGINLKGISSSIGKYSGWAFATDIGGLYNYPVKNLRLGFAVQNIGTLMKLIDQKDPLPVNFKIGIAKKLPETKLLLSAEANKSIDSPLRWNMGTEFIPIKLIALRGGYKIGYDLDTYTVGMGFRFKPKGLDELQIDYAYNPMGDVGNTHRFTLITRF